MNIKIHFYHPIVLGIYARFMKMMRHTLPHDVENIYFDSTPPNAAHNPFDWIFDQYYDNTFTHIEEYHIGLYHPNALGLLEHSQDYNKLKLVCSKIRVHKNILDWVDQNSNQFSENYLGVHLRLGDMNLHHPEHGLADINDYIRRINEILEKENVNKIFVASDSYESLEILDRHFSSQMTYIPNIIRAQNMNFERSPMFANINNHIFWEEAIKEVLLLSRCNQLLCRVSSFADASMLFSKTLTKIHRVN